MISTITQGSGANAMNFAYTYDSRGNITSETRNGVTTTYEYDELGQLIRVNDPNDPAADSVRGTTWVYSYDRGGNILQKLAYVLSSDAQPSELRQSLIYEYTDANWKDKLTLFCNDELEYDAIGNLTDDGQWTYTWEKGRQLKSMHNASTGVTMEFKYNQNGIRTQKIKKVNGSVTETTDYILKGKTVAAMKKNTDTYYFTYDASGKPITVSFNGANYTYVKNLQNDIVGILDASGNMVVEYMYDAWGNAISIYSASTTVDGLAFDNPFRYRGYVWDDETRLYYLRSRYYNSELGRFLNTDAVIESKKTILLSNLITYCSNNPITYMDEGGMSKTYVFYYTNTSNDKDLIEEALNSPYFDPLDPSVIMIGIQNRVEFIRYWNSMDSNVTDIYIYVHGDKGNLEFSDGGIGVGNGEKKPLFITTLKSVEVSGKIHLFSCYGAKDINGSSLANELALLTQGTVVACNTGVNFRFKPFVISSSDAVAGITGASNDYFHENFYARGTLFSYYSDPWYEFTYEPITGSVEKRQIRNCYLYGMR